MPGWSCGYCGSTALSSSVAGGCNMSAEAVLEHNYGQQLAKPLHIQRVENALKLEPFLGYVENILTEPVDDR